MSNRLFIIADDLTGAMDTGIQFAKLGVNTKTTADYPYDFSDEMADVLVMNSETRHISAKEAYDRVYAATKQALNHGVTHIYKKTDSALRGNIGAELAAVLDASGQKQIHFIPAFPKAGRITKNQIALINGVPVSESMFGKDPLNPVRHSDIVEIIHEQCETPVLGLTLSDLQDEKKKDMLDEFCGIVLYDAECQENLCEIAEFLKVKGDGMLCAGCAGFAAVYDQVVGLNRRIPQKPLKTEGMLVFCGSLNPISKQQLEYAKAQGFGQYSMSGLDQWSVETAMEQLQIQLQEYGSCMLDTFEVESHKNDSFGETVRKIPDTIGKMIVSLMQQQVSVIYTVIGGDTLMGFMRMSGCKELIPVCEIGNGAVLSQVKYQDRYYQIISKSGGLGAEDIIVEMYQTVCQNEE